MPVHVNAHEADWVSRVTGIAPSELTSHQHGDVVQVGSVPIELLHTPGHTPGSQCFLLDGRVGGRRHAVPGGLRPHRFPGRERRRHVPQPAGAGRVAGRPDLVFPGHWYSAEPSAPLDDVRRTNYVYRARDLDQWRMLMGG